MSSWLFYFVLFDYPIFLPYTSYLAAGGSSPYI